jgi:uncharacterized protein YlxW (UPF0749 family)
MRRWGDVGELRSPSLFLAAKLMMLVLLVSVYECKRDKKKREDKRREEEVQVAILTSTQSTIKDLSREDAKST